MIESWAMALPRWREWATTDELINGVSQNDVLVWVLRTHWNHKTLLWFLHHEYKVWRDPSHFKNLQHLPNAIGNASLQWKPWSKVHIELWKISRWTLSLEGNGDVPKTDNMNVSRWCDFGLSYSRCSSLIYTLIFKTSSFSIDNLKEPDFWRRKCVTNHLTNISIICVRSGFRIWMFA